MLVPTIQSYQLIYLLHLSCSVLPSDASFDNVSFAPVCEGMQQQYSRYRNCCHASPDRYLFFLRSRLPLAGHPAHTNVALVAEIGNLLVRPSDLPGTVNVYVPGIFLPGTRYAV